jgi:predicted aspartyl protease
VLTVDIDIFGPEGAVTRQARIDTGADGGLIMPIDLAKSIGAVLVKPRRPVVGADGRPISGMATTLDVRLHKDGVGAETPVFCQRGPSELLIGAFFLAQIGASMEVGNLKLRFNGQARHAANWKPTRTSAPGLLVLPTRRPIGRWW